MKLFSFKSKQRGMSFFGLIFVCAVLAFSGIIVAQVVPTFIEYQAIKKAAKKAASEGSNIADVRRIFESAAAIDDFKAVTGKDLEVTKDGDNFFVKFDYSKEIPLGGPAFLVIKYAGNTRIK